MSIVQRIQTALNLSPKQTSKEGINDEHTRELFVVCRSVNTQVRGFYRVRKLNAKEALILKKMTFFNLANTL